MKKRTTHMDKSIIQTPINSIVLNNFNITSEQNDEVGLISFKIQPNSPHLMLKFSLR